jgi:hypothetical protein
MGEIPRQEEPEKSEDEKIRENVRAYADRFAQPEAPKEKFVAGQEVFVPRSSGKIDSGWQVDSYDQHGVIVSKEDENGKKVYKNVSEDQLDAIQEGVKEFGQEGLAKALARQRRIREQRP